jgi:hypothetical protein
MIHRRALVLEKVLLARINVVTYINWACKGKAVGKVLWRDDYRTHFTVLLWVEVALFGQYISMFMNGEMSFTRKTYVYNLWFEHASSYLSDLLDELNGLDTSLCSGDNKLWLSDKLKLLIREEYLWQSKMWNAKLECCILWNTLLRAVTYEFVKDVTISFTSGLYSLKYLFGNFSHMQKSKHLTGPGTCSMQNWYLVHLVLMKRSKSSSMSVLTLGITVPN